LVGSCEAGGIKVEAIIARMSSGGSFENDGSDAIPLAGRIPEQSFTLRDVIPAD
jgi:hypothetical protein